MNIYVYMTIVCVLSVLLGIIHDKIVVLISARTKASTSSILLKLILFANSLAIPLILFIVLLIKTNEALKY